MFTHAGFETVFCARIHTVPCVLHVSIRASCNKVVVKADMTIVKSSIGKFVSANHILQISFPRKIFLSVNGPLHNAQKVVTVCKQVVTNLFTSCQQIVFALLVPLVVVTSLEQAVNNL